MRTFQVSERSLYSMRSEILSQWRDRRMGVRDDRFGTIPTCEHLDVWLWLWSSVIDIGSWIYFLYY